MISFWLGVLVGVIGAFVVSGVVALLILRGAAQMARGQ